MPAISARGRVTTLWAVLALLASVLAACSSSGADLAPTTLRATGRPNIVFVLTDDLSYDLLPYMPHVLAREHAGTSFSNYTVTDSECCPSRSSIFTGMYSHDTHVLSNHYPTGGFRRTP